MKMKPIVSIITGFFIMLMSMVATAQRSPQSGELFVSGFSKKLKGNEIQYTSGIEGMSNAMLTRADTGKQRMIWETASVPVNNKKDEITFVHYIGYGTKKAGTIFNFYVNDVKQGEIALPKKEKANWTIDLKNNQKLHFERHYIDGNHDYFGFLYYTVPAKNLKANKPLQLEITGANEKKLTWLMVFKKDLTASLNVVALPSIVNLNGKRQQSLLAEINHLEKPTKAQLLIDGKIYKEIQLKTGSQSVEILYPEVKKEKTMRFTLDIGKRQLTASAVIKPVKKWSIDFIQHSHTDIGYTDKTHT